MTATCLNGDCLELMKDLPDKSVDLFLCDLPYGCLTGGAGKERKKRVEKYGEGGTITTGGCSWDIKIDLVAFWEQVKRLCKNDNTPVLMFCNTRFGSDLIDSNRDWFRYDLVLNKQRGTNFLQANTRPMISHEMIYVFSKKGAFYKRIDHPMEGNNRCPLSILNFKSKLDKRHPTAKSIPLLQWLIERYSNEGDTVLDPTAGSFNSGRAAAELGRNYIGIEMDANFYEKNKL